MKSTPITLFTVATIILSALSAKGTEMDFQVVSWNVESGGSRISHIAREITEDFEGVELCKRAC